MYQTKRIVHGLQCSFVSFVFWCFPSKPLPASYPSHTPWFPCTTVVLHSPTSQLNMHHDQVHTQHFTAVLTVISPRRRLLMASHCFLLLDSYTAGVRQLWPYHSPPCLGINDRTFLLGENSVCKGSARTNTHTHTLHQMHHTLCPGVDDIDLVERGQAGRHH